MPRQASTHATQAAAATQSAPHRPRTGAGPPRAFGSRTCKSSWAVPAQGNRRHGRNSHARSGGTRCGATGPTTARTNLTCRIPVLRGIYDQAAPRAGRAIGRISHVPPKAGGDAPSHNPWSSRAPTSSCAEQGFSSIWHQCQIGPDHLRKCHLSGVNDLGIAVFAARSLTDASAIATSGGAVSAPVSLVRHWPRRRRSPSNSPRAVDTRVAALEVSGQNS
jgi:hypothetical protein